MSLHSILFASRWLCVALAIAWGPLVSPSAPAWAEEPSADEILKKSQEAMQPPIQYRIRTSGIDAKVSQKIMPDGTLASRTETEIPFPKISLRLENDSYDAFPAHGIAIDTQFMLQGAKAQADTLASSLQGQPANSAKIKEIVVRDGRKCYMIEIEISPKVISAFSKTLPEVVRKTLPSGNRFIIDKETYLIVEIETLSGSSSPTMKMEYKDIVLNPNLADELFLLPVGLEIQQPKTMNEYAAIVSEIIQSGVQIPEKNTEATSSDVVPKARRTRRPRLGPVTIDPRTGEAIPPLPVGMTRLEFDVLTDPPKSPLKMPLNHSWFRWFLMLLPLHLGLGVLAVNRWKASRSTLAQAK